jgi:hypothetical protein
MLVTRYKLMIKKNLTHTLIISCFLLAILMLFEGCAASKYPYRKKRKSRKCNECPKWGYADPAPVIQMKADGTI